MIHKFRHTEEESVLGNQLIWIYTVGNLICEFISTIWIKESDWVTIIGGPGIS